MSQTIASDSSALPRAEPPRSPEDVRLPLRRRQQGVLGSPGLAGPAYRRRDWTGLSPAQVLARYPKGKSQPLKVLEIYIELFNGQHTRYMKSVSHKTRQERAQFLRRFFRDLKAKAGFKTLPDPRNLGTRHVQAIVKVWQAEHLAPATIQTYFSFLRGFSQWLGKPGFIRPLPQYGLGEEEYERQEAATRDHGWSAAGVPIDEMVQWVTDFDPHVGCCLRVMHAFGLRKKEAVMLQPHRAVVPATVTDLPSDEWEATDYLLIDRGSKGGRKRCVPVASETQRHAVALAQSLVSGKDGNLGDPSRDLRQNLRRFEYVLTKFGITKRGKGVTSHGLRHQHLLDQYEARTGGQRAPVRAGGPVPPDLDLPARQAVAELAGHGRRRASTAYLGSSAITCS